MSNRYKDYFDNISPDKKLTEDTLKKMREEMSNEKKPVRFDIRPFVAVAACAAVTVSALLLSPDLGKLGNGQNGKDAAIENVTVTTTAAYVTENTSDSQAVTTAVSEFTEAAVSNVSSVAVTEKVTVTSIISSSAGNKGSTAEAVSSSSSGKETAASQVISSESEKVTVRSETAASVTEPVVTEPVYIPDTEPSVSQTDAAIQQPVTSRPDLRPGGNSNHTSVTTEFTVTRATDSDNSGNQYFIEDYAGDTAVILNYGVGYYCPVPRTVTQPEQEKIIESFGRNILPESITDEYEITSCYSDTQDRFFEKGICMTIGKETELDSYSGRFVLIAAATSEPYYGFDQRYFSSEMTEINGKNYFFGINSGLPDVYFCRFEINGIYYKIVFKGYSLDEAVNLISKI